MCTLSNTCYGDPTSNDHADMVSSQLKVFTLASWDYSEVFGAQVQRQLGKLLPTSILDLFFQPTEVTETHRETHSQTERHIVKTNRGGLHTALHLNRPRRCLKGILDRGIYDHFQPLLLSPNQMAPPTDQNYLGRCSDQIILVCFLSFGLWN